jgi:hypothetical protein
MLASQGLLRSILNGTCFAGRAFRRARIDEGGRGRATDAPAPQLVQLGLERVRRALECVGRRRCGRDKGLPVLIEGRAVERASKLDDGTSLAFLDQQEEGGRAVHRSRGGP